MTMRKFILLQEICFQIRFPLKRILTNYGGRNCRVGENFLGEEKYQTIFMSNYPVTRGNQKRSGALIRIRRTDMGNQVKYSLML